MTNWFSEQLSKPKSVKNLITISSLAFGPALVIAFVVSWYSSQMPATNSWYANNVAQPSAISYSVVIVIALAIALLTGVLYYGFPSCDGENQ